MSSIQTSTLNKLSLAKEMFTLGHLNGKKNNRVDNMLSILNFDFTVVTLIVASCIDSGENPKQNNGRAKRWNDLLSALQNFYNNQPLISDIDSLHDLRNSIQHGDIIPSGWDITRFEKITKDFFDDILLQVYQNQITFDLVSLAGLLKSPHEKILMECVEQYIDKGNYPLAYQFLLTAAVYHYMLIISNLKLPFGRLNLEHQTVSDSITAEQGVETLSDRLQQAINRLAMGEHYLRLLEILGKSTNPIDLESPYYSLSKQEPVQGISYTDIQEDKAIFYNIISGTENWITEKLIVDVPIIYGAHISDVGKNTAKLNFGLLAKLPFENCNLELYPSWKNLDTPDKTISLPKEAKFHSIPLDDLKSETNYFCKIEATQEGDPDYNNNRSLTVARVKFKTKS